MTDHSMIEKDLADYVVGEAWPESTPDGAPIPPETQDQAEKILYRLRRLDAERDEIEQVAEAQIQRITQWREDRLAGIDRDSSWGRRALEVFWRGAARPGRRFVDLPDGRLQLTKTRWHTVLTDKPAFLAWAFSVEEAEHGTVVTIPAGNLNLVRVKIEPDLAELGKLRGSGPDDALRADVALPSGELVPGVECQRDTADSFGIKANL